MSENNSQEKNKIVLTKKAKIAIIVVACLLAAVLVGGGVFCAVTEQSPVAVVKSAFTSNKKEICANWQSQDKPELIAYVFYEDGTYDSFLSNFNFDGEYNIDGNELSLYNPDTEKKLVYKFSITGNVLTLTLIKEDGKDVDEKEVTKFDKVDELNMKSLSDIISSIKDKEQTETTTQK